MAPSGVTFRMVLCQESKISRSPLGSQLNDEGASRALTAGPPSPFGQADAGRPAIC